MLKQIETADLHVGMYVAKIADKWFESPFWRSSFLLTKEKEIQTLLDNGFSSVWIDVTKGLDPAKLRQPQHEVKEATIAADISIDAGSSIAVPILALTEQPSRVESLGFRDPIPVALDEPGPAPLETERARAAAICGKARRAMAVMFGELRIGQAVSAEQMLPVVDEISQSVLRNSDALLGLVRLKTKNDYTYMHSVAVCALMVALARQLGMPENEVRDAGLAGLLHDIGKMAVPNGISLAH